MATYCSANQESLAKFGFVPFADGHNFEDLSFVVSSM
jgi:hypothetical protein